MHDTQANFHDFNTGCLCVKKEIITPYSMFFAKTQVFLSRDVILRLQDSINVLEKVITSDDFKKHIFKERYDAIKNTKIEGGVFMSYDFHINGNIPKLIEINTNAGGAFLNYELRKATQECCRKTQVQDISHFEEDVVAMFKEEFAKKNNKKLETVLIVDEEPEQQFLYPEFLICKDILERNGITVYIADPKEVIVKDNALYMGDIKIDLMYNRLTDFYFEADKHTKFLELLPHNHTVITPSKDDHALFADKINFLVLQDKSLISPLLSESEYALLQETLLETMLVDDTTKDYLWMNRKKYFFKPFNGFGGRGAYNGKGLTKSVWENIISGGYLAQEIIAPNTRVRGGEEKEIYKFDVRVYTYKGKMLLVAARMYQGQTTNFRTVGGGFAPVLITDK